MWPTNPSGDQPPLCERINHWQMAWREGEMLSTVQWAVPENIHSHPKEAYWKFCGDKGFQKSKYLRWLKTVSSTFQDVDFDGS